MAVTVFRMTQISMTMVEGKIVKWLKAEGDSVTEGQPLLEVETDKIAVEIPAPASGLLRKIIVTEGDFAEVGAPVCLIAAPGDDLAPYLGNAAASNAVSEPDKAQAIPRTDITEPAGKIRISPLAKKVAQDLGVDTGTVMPTGPGGLIVKADIEKAFALQGRRAAPVIPAPPAGGEVEIVPLRGIRQRIAENMTLSKQNAADVTTVMEVDMTQVAACRQFMPVSYTTFVVKAAAKALLEFPMLNSSLVNREIHIKKQINICVAVATETGLVTPVIREPAGKNLLTVAEEMDVLARKGRDGMLTPQDFADGTFTVTNSGIFGSLLFTPIINYPQCAILGMGKVAKVPVVRGDDIVAAPMMYLCLTYDHRIVDGAPAVKFLKKIKSYLEAPEQIIMEKLS